MLVKTDTYWLISQNSNTDYGGTANSPVWTTVGSMKYYAHERAGAGVEPHYHDNDEIWIFADGRGEVWIDGRSYEITHNTAVYTPMGAVHRYQMFTDYDTVAVVTKMERQKRAAHLYPEEHGPQVPTVPGFVIPGAENGGPIADRGDRCPFTELRRVELRAGGEIAETVLSANEHWAIAGGTVELVVDGNRAELTEGDVAMLRAGASRRIFSRDGGRLGLART